jgi:hypothetical protein
MSSGVDIHDSMAWGAVANFDPINSAFVAKCDIGDEIMASNQ